MKENLKQLSKQFLSAQKTISQVQPLLSMYIYPICAELFVGQGVEPDKDKLKQCERLLVKKSGLFSAFSGTPALLVVSLLSMSKDPERKYQELEEAHEIVCRYFPRIHDYVALASIVLCEENEREHWEETAKMASEIYARLKDCRRILASGVDILVSLILARSGKEIDDVIADAKSCEGYLSTSELDPKSLHSLCRVLTLVDSNWSLEERCHRFTALYENLRKHGRQYGKKYQIPMLGLAAMLPHEVDEIAQDIMDVDHYLSRDSMYKGMVPKYSKTVRLLHAAMIVAGSEGGTANLYIAMEVTIWILLDAFII